DIAALFGTVCDGKGNLYCVCGKDAIAKGMKAGNIVKQAAMLTGGNGGGRPESASASIGDISKAEMALEYFQSVNAQ
ncbi:MAG: hypothetical protein LBR54_02565, partial [Oscillospiraceae bacterium]|nr:hypothetical protein [Oscillospiraceae bacterium]